MPKQCPDCASFTDDDLRYCRACARDLQGEDVSRFTRVWQSMAMIVASASIAGAALFYFWRDSGR